MNYALLTVGSRGDLQPYLALALALKARGHGVKLCGPSNFQGLVEALGVDFVPLPWDTRQALQEQALRERLLAGDVVGFFRQVQRRGWELREGLWAALESASKGADALIPATTTEDQAVLLGRALGKPVILNELIPFAPRPDLAPLALGRRSFGPLNLPVHWVGRQVWWWVNRAVTAGLARKLGQPAPWSPPALQALAREPRLLGAYSAALVPPPRGWDASLRPVTGAWRLPRSAAQALPGDHHDAGFAAWLEDGPPPVYLGFGSMPGAAGLDLLELAGDLAELLDLRVVLGAGWSGVDSAACDLPENVAISAEVDQAWLFERCCAVVHHGGAGTTHAASASGLPQVICPFFADQPFWAQSVARVGAGRVLPFRRLGSEALAAQLAVALEQDSDGAVALGQALAREPGAEAAAEAIERWTA